MNVIGVHIVFFQQDGCSLQKPFARGAIGAIWRINAWNAQNAAANTRSPQKSNGIFCINPPNGPGCMRLNRPRFRHPLALTIAINTTGRSIHQRSGQSPFLECTHQIQSTRIGRPCPHSVGGGRGQMKDPRRPTGQALQGLAIVQVANDRLNALSPQTSCLFGAGGQCHNPRSAHQLFGSALTHITTSDDQNTLFSKAGG